MKKIKYQILGAAKGKMIDWEGYRIAPGLAIGRAFHWPRKWVLTHLPSGKAVTHSFNTRKKALSAATELAKIADWTLPERELITGDLREKAREVMEKSNRRASLEVEDES